MTITFKAPYGTNGQHVISPAQHLGYRYIVAALVDGGSASDYIIRACIEAHENGLPKDAVCYGPSTGSWQRRGDMRNFAYGRRLDGYAAALTRYEQDLKAERARERST